MKTVLITGAEGFTGARLVRRLRADGYELVAAVRNRARKLAYERQGVRSLVCDVADAINVARVVAIARPDAVAHLAGPAVPADAATEPLLAYQSTVSAWANVLDAVRRTVPRARVLLVSSAAVYGQAAPGSRLTEASLAQPVVTFGDLKRAAEEIAATFYRHYHLNIAIARPFLYTGPGEPGRFRMGALARTLAAWDPAVKGREFAIGDLSEPGDWLHVDDVVEAYVRILTGGPPNSVYNVCSGKAIMFGELVGALVAELGLDLQLVEGPGARLKPDSLRIGDPARLTAELEWVPTRTVESAVRELARSLRATPEVATS